MALPSLYTHIQSHMSHKTYTMKIQAYMTIIFLVTMASLSCNKDTFTPVEITYLVLIKPSNTVTINCYNDYYFDTQTLTPIKFTSEGLYFRSTHIVKKEEDYYLSVNYTDSTKAPEDNFVVWVKYNDSTITKQTYKYAKPFVEIKGRVMPM